MPDTQEQDSSTCFLCFSFSEAVKNSEEARPTNYLTSALATIFSSGHFVKVTRTQVHRSAELLQKVEIYTMNSVIKFFTSTLCCRLFCKRIIPLQFQELQNVPSVKYQEKLSCLQGTIYTCRMEQKTGYYLIQSMKNQQHAANPPAQC